MLSIDAPFVVTGYAKYAAADIASNVAIKTTAPSNGVVVPANCDSAIILVSGSKCYIDFQGNAATSNSFELPTGSPLILTNSRAAIKNINILRSDASTVVCILYGSVLGS